MNTVFYGGADSSAWSTITIGDENSYLTSATRYYYSESDPGTSNTHWRWVDGEPTVWVQKLQQDFTITFTTFTDIDEPEISAGTIYLLGGTGRPTTATITMAAPHLYDSGSIKWYLGSAQINTGISGNFGETLTVDTTIYNMIRQYSVTAVAAIEGSLYSKIVTFEVRP